MTYANLTKGTIAETVQPETIATDNTAVKKCLVCDRLEHIPDCTSCLNDKTLFTTSKIINAYKKQQELIQQVEMLKGLLMSISPYIPRDKEKLIKQIKDAINII